MKRKIILSLLVLVLLGIGYLVAARINLSEESVAQESTITSAVRFVESNITATGTVVAQNQAKLAFQTSGKLTYLPFQEGDEVKRDQTIAKLDTYALQRQLTAALNTYRSTRDSFDQTQDNAESGVLQGSQKYSLEVTNRGSFSVDSVMGDIVKRILDQSQATLDNSVISVELANYALQLSTLTSPIDGVVTHEDVSVAGVNITPATSFVISDPDSMVFRANIPASNIYYVNLGSQVTLAIDGFPENVNGVVSKIYPTKVTLASGKSVYQVDIVSDEIISNAKLDQAGTAIISTDAENVALVPAWTVLDGKYVWVEENGAPQLKEVTIGKVHDNEIEIISGLSEEDKIIANPKNITNQKYKIL